MHWFTYANQNGLDCLWPSLQVAVLTKPPMLDAVCIVDADDAQKKRWLKAHDVTVVERSVSFPGMLRRHRPDRLQIAMGAYLRFEVPAVCDLLGITDRYILTTDCDVMFLDDLSGLERMRPVYLAAAPQFDLADWSFFNSGVMLLNRPAFAANLDKLIACIPKLSHCQGFDQDTLNHYYAKRWNWLPVEYNWKPYWGANPAAKIVHFHGPKAHTCAPVEGEPDAAIIRSHTSVAQLVHELRRGGFGHYSEIWRSHFAMV